MSTQPQGKPSPLLRAVGHKLRSPLVQVFNAADELRSDQGDVAKRHAILDGIQSQSETALQTIDKLMNMLRIEEARPLHSRRSLVHIVDEAIHSVVKALAAANRIIDVSNPPDLPELYGSGALYAALKIILSLFVELTTENLSIRAAQIEQAVEVCVELKPLPALIYPIPIEAFSSLHDDAYSVDLFISQRLAQAAIGQLVLWATSDKKLACVKLTIPTLAS